MTIKTFRGQIVSGGQDTIVLHTNDGKTGYRIVKFEIMPDDPNQNTIKHVVKIFSVIQDVSAIDDTVDFNNQTLLGAATYNEAPGPQDQSAYESVIFDSIIFNQDIFITNFEPADNRKVNYYIELEQIKLDLNESTVATLKNIRNIA